VKAKMEGIIMEYHFWFMSIAIALFILELMTLFFSDLTKEKIFLVVILAGLNMNLCWISCYSFLSINILGFDTSGNVVNNPTADMWMFFAIFLGIFFVNIGLIIYSHVALMKLETDKRKQPVTNRPLYKS
jgi:Ni,Fe-hydrogenase I cytochrome b subunit